MTIFEQTLSRIEKEGAMLLEHLEVTDNHKFQETIQELTLNIWFYEGFFYGDVIINGMTVSGRHHPYEYEESFGFKLV